MAFLAFDQIQRTVVQIILKLSEYAGINDLLDLYVWNGRTTFLVRTFDISLSLDIGFSNEISKAKDTNCMKTFIQIREFLYLIGADWVLAVRIDTFYLLVLVILLFVFENSIILDIIKLQSTFPLLFGLFLDLRERVFLAILE